jgi:hypothetical protein
MNLGLLPLLPDSSADRAQLEKYATWCLLLSMLSIIASRGTTFCPTRSWSSKQRVIISPVVELGSYGCGSHRILSVRLRETKLLLLEMEPGRIEEKLDTVGYPGVVR